MRFSHVVETSSAEKSGEQAEPDVGVHAPREPEPSTWQKMSRGRMYAAEPRAQTVPSGLCITSHTGLAK